MGCGMASGLHLVRCAAPVQRTCARVFFPRIGWTCPETNGKQGLYEPKSLWDALPETETKMFLPIVDMIFFTFEKLLIFSKL